MRTEFRPGAAGPPWLPRSRIAGGLPPVVIPINNAELIRQGWPSMLAPPVTDGFLLLCDAATPAPQVDTVNAHAFLGQNTPSWQVAFGLPPGKLGMGQAGADPLARWETGGAVIGDIALENWTVSLLLRTSALCGNPELLIGKYNGAAGWILFCQPGVGIEFYSINGGGSQNAIAAINIYDSDYHLLTASWNRAAGVSLYLDSVPTVLVGPIQAGSLTVGSPCSIGGFAAGGWRCSNSYGWVAMWTGIAATRTGHDNMVAALGL